MQALERAYTQAINRLFAKDILTAVNNASRLILAAVTCVTAACIVTADIGRIAGTAARRTTNITPTGKTHGLHERLDNHGLHHHAHHLSDDAVSKRLKIRFTRGQHVRNRISYTGKGHISHRSHSAESLIALTLKPRSEEHTSELQSRGHLVCRLLLE